MTIQELRHWLLHRAVPLWLAHGIDRPAGGYHELLAPDGYACDAPFRRLRVAARQIYVFCAAHREGVPQADAAAALGLDFLARHAAQPEGGYAWRFNLRNEPTDTTRDLYDHAFVLLALSAATAILPPDRLRGRALALLRYLDTHFAHPRGGYVESLPPALPRRQNPHMHLFEALLAAFEAFGDPLFATRAKSLRALFLDRLFDPAAGALPEFFDDSLQPVLQDGTYVTEPGHHAEWVWLLHRAAVLLGPDGRAAEAAARLAAFADRHGMTPGAGDYAASVESGGRQHRGDARLWPQTERLKSDHLRADTSPALRARAATNLAAWLKPDGLWHEHRAPDGGFRDGPAPASSLYHLTCGILTAAAAP